MTASPPYSGERAGVRGRPTGMLNFVTNQVLSCPLSRSRIGHAVAAFGLGMTAVITTPQALASSHREAPFIAMNPSVDATVGRRLRANATKSAVMASLQSADSVSTGRVRSAW